MKYDANSIEVLDARDAVRKRPGMYIGGTDKQGLHHLLKEIVDNAVDEFLNGHASEIKVTLHKDKKSVTILDNGRGIPTDIEKKTGKSGVEVVFTHLHAGAKFNTEGAYKGSGGLHGVGAAVTNFLSKSLSVTVYKKKEKAKKIDFFEGVSEKGIITLEDTASKVSGTEVTFTPDFELFECKEFEPSYIHDYLKNKTFVNSKLKIIFEDKYGNEVHTFYHENGLLDFLKERVTTNKYVPLNETPFDVQGETQNIQYHIMLQWTNSTSEDANSFVNAIHTSEGGTHEAGVKDGVVKALKAYMDIQGVKSNLKLKSEDFREGLVSITNIFYAGDLQFQSQNKVKLNNPEIQGVLSSAIKNQLEQMLFQNPSTSDEIVERILAAAKARQASRIKQDLPKKLNARKLTLPGKLADCESNDPSECEIFLTEGDSASGTGKMARDRKVQAILPLRGKVLNSENVDIVDVMKNKELSAVVEALGCGIGKSFNTKKLRYHKIILLMDADSDGHHITTLMLTFFFRHMPELIEGGFIYLANPPLYRIVWGKNTEWVFDDEAKNKILANIKTAPEIYRFKGLGEMMPDTLWETTLNPSTRKLIQVEIPDKDETDVTFQSLMGKDSKARFEMVQENLSRINSIDF